MAKVREMKAKVSHETIAGIVIADASAVCFPSNDQCSCLQDDLRAPGLDAAAQAELEAEQSAATAEVQRATQAEGLSRRMGQAARDELRRLEAEVAEERVSFQEFEPWFAEHEPQLHPEGLLFEKFVSATTNVL